MGFEDVNNKDETPVSDDGFAAMPVATGGMEINHKKTVGEWLKNEGIDWVKLLELQWPKGNQFGIGHPLFINQLGLRVRPVLGESEQSDFPRIQQAFGYLSTGLAALKKSKGLVDIPDDVLSPVIEALERWNPNTRPDKEDHMNKLNAFLRSHCAQIDRYFGDDYRDPFAFDPTVFKQDQLDELMAILEAPKNQE